MTLNNLFSAYKIVSNLNRSKTFDERTLATNAFHNADANVRGMAESMIAIQNAFKSGGIIGGFKEIGKSVGSLIKAHPALTAFAATAAAVKVYDLATVNVAEQFEKASNAVNEYQQTVSELESVNSELQNINARMDELNAKGHLSLVESEELDKLERSNTELERRKSVLEALEKGNLEAAKQSTDDYLSETSDVRKDYSGAWGHIKASFENNSGAMSMYDPQYHPTEQKWLTPIEIINSYIRGAKNIQGEIDKLNIEMDEAAKSNDTNKIKKLEKNRQDLEEKYRQHISVISEEFDDIGEISDNFNEDYFDPDKYVEIMNAMDEFNAIIGSSGKSKEANIEGLLAKTDYKGIKDTLINLAKQAPLTADSLENAGDSVKNFLSDLSKKNISADDIVQYFNALADPDAYNFDNIRKQFKETLATATDKTFTTEQKAVVEDYKQVFDEAQKLKQEGADLNQTVFGNIDTNNRQVLKWTDENLKAYKKAIQSWDYKPDDLKGSTSTVFGTYEDFGDDEHPLNIAFSPMLQTENGAVLLKKGTVEKYIESLIEKADEEAKEIGKEGFENEDLFKLDTEGLDIDGQYIKGLIADIGDTAEQTSKLMHFQGKDGALAMSLKEVGEIAKKTGLDVNEVLDSINNGAEEFVKNLSEDELEAYVTIKASGVDTSDWTIEDWKANVEKQLEVEAKVNIKATPKLDEFTQAKESENSGKNYDTIVSSLESVKKLYEGGLVGTDDFLSFAKLISPNDVATVSEYEKYVGNIAKYFTEDLYV